MQVALMPKRFSSHLKTLA